MQALHRTQSTLQLFGGGLARASVRRNLLRPCAAVSQKLDLPLTWPPGAAPYAALGGAVAVVAAAFLPAARSPFPVNVLRRGGVNLFGSVSGFQAAVGVGAALHVLEAAFAQRMCKDNQVSDEQASQWAAMTFFVGVPALIELNSQLERARRMASAAAAVTESVQPAAEGPQYAVDVVAEVEAPDAAPYPPVNEFVGVQI